MKRKNRAPGPACAVFAAACLLALSACGGSAGADTSEGGTQAETDAGSGYSVACLGDSITEGVGVDSEKERYTVLMEADEGIGSVQNVGFSGSTIGDTPDESCSYMNRYAFTERYTQIAEGTDLIFVLGGTNDYGTSLGQVPLGEMGDADESTFYGALEVLADGLSAEYPDAQLLFATPLPRYDTDMTAENTYGATLEEYRDAVLEECAGRGIETLDLFTLGEVSPEADGHEDYFADGLHPNAAGNALLAETVLEKILEMKG